MRVTESNIESVVDRIGAPIDKGIYEVVLELNRLGFETLGSCEGHLKRACSNPWVTVSPDSRIYELVSKFNRSLGLKGNLALVVSKLYREKDSYILRIESGGKCITGGSSEFHSNTQNVMEKFGEYLSKLEAMED